MILGRVSQLVLLTGEIQIQWGTLSSEYEVEGLNLGNFQTAGVTGVAPREAVGHQPGQDLVLQGAATSHGYSSGSLDLS